MNADCFQILARHHPRYVETFRPLGNLPASEVAMILSRQFFTVPFDLATVAERDVVLWRDPNGKVHLSTHECRMFCMIGRDGRVKRIPLRPEYKRLRLRPFLIVREIGS